MGEVKVGLIGFGTVGAGLAQLFFEHGKRLNQRVGTSLRLTRIADLDLTSDRGVAVPEGVLTASADDILNDPEIQIVVELIGGLDKARSFILRAIDSGKQVVTANKALLAEHGNEIFGRAEEKGVGIYYEASVAGGIPLIRSIREGLAADRVTSLHAILNGTCNYILSRMTQDKAPFDQVLKQAQADGLAETDPSLDIDGADTAHKLAILISLCFGGPLQFEKLSVEGIRDLDQADIIFAREFGYVIKLLAIARLVGDQVEARVHPTMIPHDHVLAAVSGAFNAIHMTADPIGEVLFYGLGAGRHATASAVAGDVIEAARNIVTGVSLRLPNLGEPGRITKPLRLRPISDLETRHYIRLNAIDKPGVLSRISGVLAEHEISIASVIQKGRHEKAVPIVMLTHQANEASVKAAVKSLATLDILSGAPVHLRIEEDS